MTTEAILGRDELRRRQRDAASSAGERGLDGLLVVGRSFYDRVGSLAYLCDHFPPFPTTAFSGPMRGAGHGALVLDGSGGTTLVVDGRSYRRDMVVADDIAAGNDMVETLPEALRRRGLAGARVGLVGEDLMPVALERTLRERLPGLTLVPADDIVAAARRIKSPAEQALLRRAADIAGAGLGPAVERCRAGAREREVAAAGTAAAIAAGADFIRYFRVHSGPDSGLSSRWPPATDRALAEGDHITIDIIGAVRGYQFDVLRSGVVGEPSLDQRRLMDAALAATERAVAACRPGARVGELVALAWRSLDDAGFGSYASGFIGHGIGLETVEEPLLTSGNDAVLETGMVLCVEPSIRIPGEAGCCIEQEIVVRDGPPELITHFPARLW